MMGRYKKVIGLAPKVYTEDDIQRDARLVPEGWQREASIRIDRHDLLGKTFVFEQLECGHLGNCLGIAGSPSVKRPAQKRICDCTDADD